MIRRLAMLSVLLALGAGCGKNPTLRPSESFPTRGRVVAADGQPVRLARIVLVPKGSGASEDPTTFAHLKEDGTFEIDTRRSKPGPYDVYLEPYNPTLGGPPAPAGVTPSDIPVPFRNPNTSNLSVTLKESENDLGLLQLKAGAPPTATVHAPGKEPTPATTVTDNAPPAKGREPVAGSPSDVRQVAIKRLAKIAEALEVVRVDGSYPDQAQGQLSWRVAILPYLGQDALFRKFHFGEPWDSDHNRALIREIPEVFQSPSRPDEKTNFMLITGPGTAYPTKQGLREERCPDGLNNTLLVAEVADRLAKPWTQPEDYAFNRATAQEDLFSLRKDCCFVVVGGRVGVRRMSADIADADLLALLSPDGREPLSAIKATLVAQPQIDTALVAELERNPVKRFVSGGASGTASVTKSPPSKVGTGTKRATTPSLPVPSVEPVQDSRLPVPDDKALAAAAATAKELYRADYEGAKKVSEKRAWAKKLLGLASHVAAEPAAMFILLRDARDISAQTGDIATALSAVDKLCEKFRLNLPSMKLKALEQTAPAIENTSETGTLFTKSLDIEKQMVANDDFDGARRALALALSAARRTSKSEMMIKVAEQREKLEELKTAFDRIAGALATLVRSPDDAAANAAVGRYLCLMKQDWPRGLPLLARGDEEKLRGLAATELTNPTLADERAALADGWWEWSEKLNAEKTAAERPGLTSASLEKLVAAERRSARLRAAHWYKQGLPGLPANLASERARQRIAEVEKDTQKEKEKEEARAKKSGSSAKTGRG